MGAGSIRDRSPKRGLSALTLFRTLAAQAGWEPCRIDRTTERVSVDFASEVSVCGQCGRHLRVVKTQTRRVITLAQGEFAAREIIRWCPWCRSEVRRSRALQNLVPRCQRYGYDLITHVALQRYRFHRQRVEIQENLLRRFGIEISIGTISALCDRFLRLFEALHVGRAPQLRQAMKRGYPLHIDGTNDTGRGGLFLCIEGWRGWVLHAANILSEKKDLIQPVLEETFARFGNPIAIVRDMGQGCAKAAAPFREQGIPDFICHYHFLADVGTDILAHLHRRLQSHLQNHQVQKTLHELLRTLRGRSELGIIPYWIFHGEGRTPRFPFGLPHLDLYHRLCSATDQARNWISRPWSDEESTHVNRLAQIAQDVQQDETIGQIVRDLTESWSLFQELRSILRLEDPSKRPSPLLLEAEGAQREEIQTRLGRYRDELRHRLPSGYEAKYSPYHVILEHLRRYKDHLFGHPVVRDESGRVVAVVDRTNNPAEHFFSRNKQDLRRRTGRHHLCRELEDLPYQVTLLSNLKDPKYVRILCGSIEELPRALASVAETTTHEKALRYNPNRKLQARIRTLCRKGIGKIQPPMEATWSVVKELPTAS